VPSFVFRRKAVGEEVVVPLPPVYLSPMLPPVVCTSPRPLHWTAQGAPHREALCEPRHVTTLNGGAGAGGRRWRAVGLRVEVPIEPSFRQGGCRRSRRLLAEFGCSGPITTLITSPAWSRRRHVRSGERGVEDADDPGAVSSLLAMAGDDSSS